MCYTDEVYAWRLIVCTVEDGKVEGDKTDKFVEIILHVSIEGECCVGEKA